MWTCPECGYNVKDNLDICWNCRAKKDGTLAPDHPSIELILSTTPFIPAHKIKKSLGVVSGEAIIGANVFSDMLASVVDVVGGRSSSYEGKLKHARQIAINEMTLEAKALGGNAIIGININHENIRGTMLMVAVCGTAVLIEPESDYS
jgi:uncharacterized protein YbjQ (UPF0145 family)